MKRFDFDKIPNNDSNYGRKNVNSAIKEIKENKGLIEVAKRLVDK
ncbi:MAG: hypothetical protein ACRC8P_00815 [Spiroplasma sp.]